MGYDLRARNKNVDDYHMGAFSWSWMINAGVGLPIGYGPGFTPGQYINVPRPDGKCIHYNDGAHVTAKEAKQMAQVARWIADHQDRLHEVFMRDETEESRKRMYDDHSRIYNVPVRRDFVDKIRGFADFAEASGGFRVY